jgi:hypothetical protein
VMLLVDPDPAERALDVAEVRLVEHGARRRELACWGVRRLRGTLRRPRGSTLSRRHSVPVPWRHSVTLPRRHSVPVPWRHSVTLPLRLRGMLRRPLAGTLRH